MLTVIFEEKNGSVTFQVRVIPRASKTAIVGEHAGAVKVKLTSPPVDGIANEELIRLLAKSIGVPRSSVHILLGSRSKTKQIRIDGVTAEECRKAFRS